MFCKICFDSCRVGYDNHNIRDFKGQTVCPYLLSIKCMTCGLNGHTVKYCKKPPVSVKKSVDFDFKPTHVNGGVKAMTTVNMFSMLCQDVNEQDIEHDGEFLLNDIDWGVGLKSMDKMSWADVCGV